MVSLTINKEKPVRVLLIGPRPIRQITGVSLAFELVCDHFRKKDLACDVVDFLKYSHGKKVGQFDFWHLLGTIAVLVNFIFKLPRCGVIYATMSTSQLGFFRDFFVTQSGKLLGKKVIFHLHGGGFSSFLGSQPKYLRKLILYNHNRIDKIIVLGESLRDQFSQLEHYREKTYIVRNGLTLGLSEPKTRIKEAPKEGEPLRLLYLSNMIHLKGYLRVLETCSLLKKKGIPFKCHFCGAFLNTSTENGYRTVNDHKRDFLKRIDRISGVNSEIIYDEKIEGKKKEQVLADSHIFILPTTYPWEGQPLCIIEAMAYSTPVISTKHKGIPEQVIDGENGWLIDPDDPKSISKAILQTISKPGLYTAMSMAARRRYEQYFRREVHLDLLQKVLLESSDDLNASK